MNALEHMRHGEAYVKDAYDEKYDAAHAAVMAQMHFTAALAHMKWSENPYNDGIDLELEEVE